MSETDRLIDYNIPEPKPGRPKVEPGYWKTLYKPEYDEIASRLSAVGFNGEDIAYSLGVPYQAFVNWKTHFPAFKEAVTDGRRDQLKRMAAKAMLEAVGYDYKTTKTETTFDAEGNIEKTKQVVFTNHQSPQPNMLIFLLCNLSSQLGLENEAAWKSRQKMEIESKSINLTISGELVSAQIAKLAGKLLGEPETKQMETIDATFESLPAQNSKDATQDVQDTQETNDSQEESQDEDENQG